MMHASKLRCFVGWLVRVVLGGVLSALAVPLLNWVFNPTIAFNRLQMQYLYSLVYAVSIGGIFFWFMEFLWVRTLRFGAFSKWASRAAGTLAGTFLGCVLAGFILHFLAPDFQFWPELLPSFRIALILSVVCISFIALWETHKAQMQASGMELKKRELERERALNLATEARLASLESRIHPHFLFNAINTVGSLIPDDPVRAERLLNQMAALLRFSLDSTRRGLVELRQELKVVQDYLDIEEARFGGRLRYSLSVPDELLPALVPPLSVQTVVENSIKYAVAVSRQGASLEISAMAGGDKMTVSVTDDGPGFTADSLIAGHGLDNLTERLAMLFKDEARLDIDSSVSRTCVSFTVPLRPPIATEKASDSPALSGRRAV